MFWTSELMSLSGVGSTFLEAEQHSPRFPEQEAKIKAKKERKRTLFIKTPFY